MNYALPYVISCMNWLRLPNCAENTENESVQIWTSNVWNYNIVELSSVWAFSGTIGLSEANKCSARNVRVQSRRRQNDDINQVSEVNDEVVLMNRRMVWLTGLGIHCLLYAKTYIRCVCGGSVLAIRWSYRDRTHPSVVWVCLVTAVCGAWIPWASIRCALSDFSFWTIAWMVIYSTMP